jgi:hypothetical protein
VTFSGNSPPVASYTSSLVNAGGAGYSQSVFSPNPTPGVGSSASAAVFAETPSAPSQKYYGSYKESFGKAEATNTTGQMYFFEVVPLSPLLKKQVTPISVQFNAMEKLAVTYLPTSSSSAPIPETGTIAARATSNITVLPIPGDIGPSEIASYTANSEVTVAGAFTTKTPELIKNTLDLYTNQVYAISMVAETYASSGYLGRSIWYTKPNGSGDWYLDTGWEGYSTSVSALADPYLVVDPNNPDADQYQILLSQGFGNSPLSSPGPLPGTGSAGLAVLALAGLCARLRRV